MLEGAATAALVAGALRTMDAASGAAAAALDVDELGRLRDDIAERCDYVNQASCGLVTCKLAARCPGALRAPRPPRVPTTPPVAAPRRPTASRWGSCLRGRWTRMQIWWTMMS